MGQAMTAKERRAAILRALEGAETPVSASALAKQLHVSRQAVVGDVAMLRALNSPIAATPRGYVLSKDETNTKTYTIACCHGRDRVAEELYAVVDNGGGLLDVIVDHALYGQLSGKLHVFSRYDADEFVRRLSAGEDSPLSSLTGGIHLHTVVCRDDACFARICAALRDKGLLIAPPED